MKKIVLLVIACLLAAAIAYAGSAGGTAPAIGKVNVPLTVPKKASTVCTNVAAGRSNAITQMTVSGTTMVNWKAFKIADGSAVTVKRSFDSYSSNYLPASSETNLPIEATITKANFKSYSTAGHRICVEMN